MGFGATEVLGAADAAGIFPKTTGRFARRFYSRKRWGFGVFGALRSVAAVFAICFITDAETAKGGFGATDVQEVAEVQWAFSRKLPSRMPHLFGGDGFLWASRYAANVVSYNCINFALGRG